ncbi:hypothetical protein N7447_003724 [Penicillium robsamsonii]|uniref:uncharacterized protein n=1 Tax=Penicillium robsamsonii TaxID=1792511 RepID=UPI0025469431|nr:uncharacterized protein N7447_003724 [Penicillium robsamsonii]KAJ5826961.1 hypothetical protein N7447_003724 [Penicillium robsamsonii]
MCLFVPSSSLALIFTGSPANLDPSLLNLDSPAPNISNVSTHSLSPFALALDFSSRESISKAQGIKANQLSLCEQRLLDRYSEYLATILYDRARSTVDTAVIAGTFT